MDDIRVLNNRETTLGNHFLDTWFYLVDVILVTHRLQMHHKNVLVNNGESNLSGLQESLAYIRMRLRLLVANHTEMSCRELRNAGLP